MAWISPDHPFHDDCHLHWETSNLTGHRSLWNDSWMEGLAFFYQAVWWRALETSCFSTIGATEMATPWSYRKKLELTLLHCFGDSTIRVPYCFCPIRTNGDWNQPNKKSRKCDEKFIDLWNTTLSFGPTVGQNLENQLMWFTSSFPHPKWLPYRTLSIISRSGILLWTCALLKLDLWHDVGNNK